MAYHASDEFEGDSSSSADRGLGLFVLIRRSNVATSPETGVRGDGIFLLNEVVRFRVGGNTRGGGGAFFRPTDDTVSDAELRLGVDDRIQLKIWSESIWVFRGSWSMSL